MRARSWCIEPYSLTTMMGLRYLSAVLAAHESLGPDFRENLLDASFLADGTTRSACRPPPPNRTPFAHPAIAVSRRGAGYVTTSRSRPKLSRTPRRIRRDRPRSPAGDRRRARPAAPDDVARSGARQRRPPFRVAGPRPQPGAVHRRGARCRLMKVSVTGTLLRRQSLLLCESVSRYFSVKASVATSL